MEVSSLLLNRILSECIKKGASSVHFSIGSYPMYRFQGKLNPLDNENLISMETLNGILNSFITEEDAEALGKKKELEIVKELAVNMRFRINVFYQKKLPAVSFYYIPDQIKPLSELGLPKILERVTELESGLFVVAGSYGSGKSTTIAGIIEEINRKQGKYIVTLENPIEHLFVSKKSMINQRQIGRDVNSVEEGINYCLKEDIDLVYVSEVRSDLKKALPLIINLASGNSLVILEVNAADSTSAVERLLNSITSDTSQKAARYSLADVLVGVFSQRLFPERGGSMRMAYEVMLVNSAIKSIIREGNLDQIGNVIQNSGQEGMISMEKSLSDLVKSGAFK